MACKINWTIKAWQTYESNIKYLEEDWNEKEIKTFVRLVDQKLLNLSTNPLLVIHEISAIPIFGLHWFIKGLPLFTNTSP